MARQIEIPYDFTNYRSFSGMEPAGVETAFEMEYERDDSRVREWLVRFIWEGRDDDPVVEFYSLRTDQFVSSYYWTTMMEHPRGHGLDLEGSVLAWSICGKDLDDILDWMLEEGCDLLDLDPEEVSSWSR